MGIAYLNHKSYPKNIYIRHFKGKVDVNEIIESWEFLLNNHLIHENTKGVINDLSECILNMDMTSFQSLINYLKEHAELRKVKLAVVCNDPRTIVFPTLGEVQERALKIKPFATEKAAVEWIMDLQ